MSDHFYRRSLKFKLLLPYVLLILLLTLAIGWLSWWAGSRTVSNLGNHLMSELTERIAQAVDRHMYGSSAVLETAFPAEMHAPEDILPDLKSMLTRFYTAASLYTNPSDYVYYGNEQGQGLGLQKLVDGTAQIRLKRTAGQYREFYLLYGINGGMDYRFAENELFDPRTRVWYQLGRDAKHHTWTAVYVDFGTQELVVTRARKVNNENGEFAGVIATDLFLSELSRFVQSLDTSENGRAFIVEPGGQLIAASSVANIKSDKTGRAVRVMAADSGDSLIESAWTQLQPRLQQFEQHNSAAIPLLELSDKNGKRFFVSVKKIRDDAGLEWYAVVAVPRSDLLQGVRETVLLVSHAGVLAMLLAAGVGLLLFGRIARDISQLSQAVKSTGHSMQDVSAQSMRKDELGVLARSFSQMRSELLTDRLTGIANRSALEYRINNLLAERRSDPVPFALLFIDLNKFKPLNDQYGHDKGDQALMEVARRMQAMLREQDMVARLGGDEFVIVLAQVGSGQVVEKIKQRVLEEISRPLDCCADIAPAGETVSLGASIGIALYPLHGTNASELLKHADQAMYEEKNAGRTVR